MNSSGGGGGGGGIFVEAVATLRRSGTMTGQLNPNKSGQQQDTQILNTQLQSVQMQLQEKHNELNYYKVLPPLSTCTI